MADVQISHRVIITALGGAAAVARYLRDREGLDITDEAVRKWSREGIAHKQRGVILRMADEQGARGIIPDGFIEGIPTDAIAPLAPVQTE